MTVTVGSSTVPTRSAASGALTTAAHVVASVLGCAAAVSALCLALRWVLVASTGVQISALEVSIAAALLGVMAAPPVRMPLERLDAEGHGEPIVLAGMLLTAAVVTVLGLSVLAAATSAGCAAHAVQVRPTRRQLASACVMVMGTSLAALGVQLSGWVDYLIEPRETVMLMMGLLLVMCPLVANAASISRRAMEAATQLDAERRRNVAALEQAARHDALTGLLNRRGMTAPLLHATASARPGSLSGVLFLDLDGFKTVNDVHGHAAGDALLVEVGRRLRRVLRPDDTASRTGGDEFVVVVEGLTEAAQGQAMAERVRVEVEREIVLPDDSRVSVGASIGVALTWSQCSGDILLRRADAEMYDVKRRRREALARLAASG